MLHDISQVISYLMKILEIRDKNKQEYFDKYVKPTYALAENVYRDYRKILCQARNMIQIERESFPVIQFLEERRTEFLSARIQLRALINQRLIEYRFTEFEKGIWGLMSGSIGSMESHISTYPLEKPLNPVPFGGHTIMDIVGRLVENGDTNIASNRELLTERIDEQLRVLDIAWNVASTGYAELQALALPNINLKS